MNRRTFLKLTGATAVLAATPLTFAEKKETPQWIRLSNQLPKERQKVVMCEITEDKTTTWYGTIERNGVQDMAYHKSLSYSMIHYEYHDMYHGSKFISRKTPDILDILCFYANDTSYRYWLPVDGDFPKTLPPFPSHASKWIDFEDQMPPNDEEIDVRDQDARIAKGWYVKSQGYDYFMPCKEDGEWLNVNSVVINQKQWQWRYA